MAIANKLGQDYEAIRAASRFKTIKVKLNDIEFDLKVRVPVKRELDAIMADISTPPQAVADAMYTKLSQPLIDSLSGAEPGLMDALNSDGDKIKILENDVILDGTSVRQIAVMSAIWQTQVEKYFSLIQSVTGEPVNESFEEISEEFPDEVIREIVTKIDQAIRPSYKDTKKN
jgi:hypothetical protein